MKRIVALLAMASAAAFAADEYTLADGVLTFNVDVADYPEATPYEYMTSLSGVTSIVKKGTGAVSLGATATANTFTGTMMVENGFLMGWKPRFGRPATVTVENGAAVVFTETSAYTTDNFADTMFYIEGDGPDGNGALQRPWARAYSDEGCLSSVTMTGDATINAGSRWGIDGGTLDMNNHTLTLSSAKEDTAYSSRSYSRIFTLSRYATTYVKNPGVIVATNACRLNVEGSTAKLRDVVGSNGTVSNMTVRLTNGTYLRLFQVYKDAFPCHVVSEGESNIMVNNQKLSLASSLKQSHMEGPVEIAGTRLNMSLYATGLEASNACLWVNGPVSGRGILWNPTRGRLYLTGTNTHVVGSIRQTDNGEFILQDSVTVNMTNAISTGTYALFGSGTSVATPPTLTVKDNARLIFREGCEKLADLMVGYHTTGGDNRYGIMKIQDNGIVSNNVQIGYYGKGACYLMGGELHMLTGNSGPQLAYASNSYGYIGVDDGFYHLNNWFYFARRGPGFFVQRAGRSLIGPSSIPFRLADKTAAAYGNLAILGGTSTWNKGYLAMNFTSYTPVGESSTSVATVASTNALMDMSESYILLCPATNAAKAVTAIVNVNDGGTLKVKNFTLRLVTNSANPSWDTYKNLVQDSTRSYLNFNGGTLVTTASGEFFANGTDPTRLLTRVTIFEKGAVIDTNGKNVTWRMPLERPYGHGIASVTLPAAALAKEALIGPTRCYITSAEGGVAADALMDFDDTNRVARGMIVTSRGFGYEAAPTVKVHQANCSDTWDCTVETVDFDAADFAHGGLTKRGAGTLTITCTNTYGGATRLEDGTLAFSDEHGYPGGDLEIAAAAVQGQTLAAPLLTAHTLAFNAGKGVRVTEADDLDDKTFGRAKTVATFTTPLAELPSLTLVDGNGDELPPSGLWCLMLTDGGRTLKFGAMRGTQVIFR